MSGRKKRRNGEKTKASLSVQNTVKEVPEEQGTIEETVIEDAIDDPDIIDDEERPVTKKKVAKQKTETDTEPENSKFSLSSIAASFELFEKATFEEKPNAMTDLLGGTDRKMQIASGILVLISFFTTLYMYYGDLPITLSFI